MSLLPLSSRHFALCSVLDLVITELVAVAALTIGAFGRDDPAFTSWLHPRNLEAVQHQPDLVPRVKHPHLAVAVATGQLDDEPLSSALHADGEVFIAENLACHGFPLGRRA
jgi:hypothetical protein